MASRNELTYISASIQCLRRLPGLSPDELAERLSVLAAQVERLKQNGWTTPWTPNEGPQALAYLSDADELFFGGSAGGGKSLLLLGLAMTAHTRSLILRMNATNLQQLKDDIQGMMGPIDRWRSIGYGGILDTADGRKIEMHGCESQVEARKFMGRAHSLKCWDEVPQFDEFTFRFVNAWNRSTDPNERCRIAAAGNPPTRPEEEWVLRYWAPWLDDQHSNPAEPGELRWFAVIDGKDVEVADSRPIKHKKEVIQPRSRTFIPARLSDNPELERTGYAATLQGLPEPLRSQLLYGSMSAGREDDEWQLLPTRLVKAAMDRWQPEGDKGKRPDAASLDCAMGGKDRMCLGKIYGDWVAPLQVWPGSKVTDGSVAVQLILPFLEWLKMPLLIDMLANPGGEVVRAFRLQVPGITVVAINFGEGSKFKDRTGKMEMANLRAEAYFRLREALEDGKIQLPKDRELLAELCSIRWRPMGGKVQLEKKIDIKARLGVSPDKADCVAQLTLANRGTGGWLAPNRDMTDKGGYQGNDNRVSAVFGTSGYLGTGLGGFMGTDRQE